MTRLTEEMVIARSKQSDLGSIKNLNCWGSDLSDVSIIKRMRGVEVLALSVNKISSLQHFENCVKLQELYLRNNNIQDINEIGFLQNLPCLKNLWLAENPCCDRAGSNYRSIVLRALPNLKKLDNIEVTQEEVQEALGGGSESAANEEESYEDAYEQPSQQQLTQHEIQQQQQQQRQQQHQQYQQQITEQRQQQQQQHQYPTQQRRSSSPQKETSQHTSPEVTEESLSEANNQSSIASSPLQRSPTNQDFLPQEQVHPPSPKYNSNSNSNSNSNPKENRMSYHQYDRSPGSDQDSSHGCYRERVPPSISTHSMKEYYQSDRPSYPVHYRHSQTDLTEWEEHQNHNQYNSSGHHHGQRRSAGAEREAHDRYPYRNGNARENGEWEENERTRPGRRPDGRFSESASVVSTAVLNHYSGFHRRPINRSSNLLSATLCLVKELDYPSLEVVEHAVRCRIDELSGE